MQLLKKASYLVFILTTFLLSVHASNAKCIENVCIGDDVEKLSISWKKVLLTYNDERFVEEELKDRDVSEVFYDYNERLIADKQVLTRLFPYVIRSQKFDESVLLELSRVQAICSSLTMTGEVARESGTRLFVSVRAAANEGGRGILRVISLEKQFNIVPAHIRPADAKIYANLKSELRKLYPNLVIVRDIDGREISSSANTAVLGFRFVSSVTNPLVFKLYDDEDVKFIEDDENASPLCKSS